MVIGLTVPPRRSSEGATAAACSSTRSSSAGLTGVAFGKPTLVAPALSIPLFVVPELAADKALSSEVSRDCTAECTPSDCMELVRATLLMDTAFMPMELTDREV